MLELIKKIACTICQALGGHEAEPPPPLPELKPAGTIDLNIASSLLLDKMEEMGDTVGDIYLPDANIKVYNKDEVKAFLGLDETDKIQYVAEVMDCDDFAAELFGKFAGLVWTNVHTLNFFISEDEQVYFIEPQSDKIAGLLEGWQGARIRFFIGR